MLVGAMTDQDHAPDRSRPGANHHYPTFRRNRASVAQGCHVAARMCALLYTRHVGTTSGMGGTRRSGYRKRGGGQTEDHQDMKGTFKKLSAHRVFYPLEIKAYIDDTCPDRSGYISNQLKVTAFSLSANHAAISITLI